MNLVNLGSRQSWSDWGLVIEEIPVAMLCSPLRGSPGTGKVKLPKGLQSPGTAALLDFHIWDLHHDHPWPMFTVLLLCVIRFVLFNICCAAASVSAFSVKMLVLPAFLDANFLTQLSSPDPEHCIARLWVLNWWIKMSRCPVLGFVRNTVVIFCDAAGPVKIKTWTLGSRNTLQGFSNKIHLEVHRFWVLLCFLTFSPWGGSAWQVSLPVS